jgi:hypothetical protein
MQATFWSNNGYLNNQYPFIWFNVNPTASNANRRIYGQTTGGTIGGTPVISLPSTHIAIELKNGDSIAAFAYAGSSTDNIWIGGSNIYGAGNLNNLYATNIQVIESR